MNTERYKLYRRVEHDRASRWALGRKTGVNFCETKNSLVHQKNKHQKDKQTHFIGSDRPLSLQHRITGKNGFGFE